MLAVGADARVVSGNHGERSACTSLTVEKFRHCLDDPGEGTGGDVLTAACFVLLIRSMRLKLLTTAPDSIPCRYRSTEDAA